MVDKQTSVTRRTTIKKLTFAAATLSAWSSPVVQSISLPAHAQTSPCVQVDIPGRWQLELFGPAASTSEIIFFADGLADHSSINKWQYSNREFQMTQGRTWVFTGAFTACDTLSGTYINLFTIPILGNIIVRRGEWLAYKLISGV